MQRLKKRLEELELIQNNIKLMNELLSHYKPDTGEQEKQLLEVILIEHALSLRKDGRSRNYIVGSLGCGV